MQPDRANLRATKHLGRTIPERPARDRLTFVPTPAPPPPAKGWGREFNPKDVVPRQAEAVGRPGADTGNEREAYDAR